MELEEPKLKPFNIKNLKKVLLSKKRTKSRGKKPKASVSGGIKSLLKTI